MKQMYKFLSTLSYLIGFWLANITIEKISIFQSETLNYFWGEVFLIYTLLMIIGYIITGKFYSKNEMSASFSVIIYFLIYCILLFLYWLVLQFLTWIGILPIIL